MFSSFMKVKI